MEAALRVEGAVAPREGDCDRWDLEARGGLLGAAHLRMAIEEHGAGKQVRFRVCSRCSTPGGVLALLFAKLAQGQHSTGPGLCSR